MTDNERSERIFERLIEDYDWVQSKGYKVLGVFLQGSQNYKLDYEGSDIDSKCIVLPSFEDFVLNKKPASTTLIKEDNSHVDVKDIRLMFECFRKQNINFLEILFTEFYVVNANYIDLWGTMWSHAEDIAHYNNYAAVNCIAGMVFEKHKALCHPYPTLKDKIDKYGYDNKQLHHIIRCEEFLNRYICGVPYQACLIPRCPSELVEVKSTYKYSLEEAKEIAETIHRNVQETLDKYKETHKLKIREDVKDMMDNILVNILKESFLEDINAEV